MIPALSLFLLAIPLANGASHGSRLDALRGHGHLAHRNVGHINPIPTQIPSSSAASPTASETSTRDSYSDPASSMQPSSSTIPTSSTPSVSSSAPSSTSTSNYKVQDIYEGSTFLDGWDFFSDKDPTNGMVNYQTQANAVSKGLAYNDGNTVVLAVDSTTTLSPGSARNSVRINSKKTYNGGLFVADFAAMPYGCSTWPAWWSVGPDWPAGGEIDILEGVHNQAVNQYTLHTSSGCTLDANPSSKRSTALFSGKLGNLNCASSGADNTGCIFHDTDPRSYGKGFNDAGGGVLAHLWNSEGIRAWHFARDDIPADINSRSPDPSTWGEPSAFFSAATCDMTKHFYEHTLVIDTTLCGDWAGSTHSSAGCGSSCAETVADPTNFSNAKWKINYIAVYDTK